jgi:chaperonin GroEL
LSSKVALIRVGGSTEIELVERKHRIEDAVCAARAALERGIIPGGGVSLARIASKLKSALKPGDQHYYGSYIVYEAASAPMKRIVDNADLNGGSIVDAVPTREDDECYDAVGRKWVKWIDAGIIDPLKVTLTALEHASSVAAAFVTLDAVVITDDLSPW